MKKIYLLYFILFSALTTYKSYQAYEAFDHNNVPVFDGVMNENRQIKSYLRFNNNFSLMERVNQAIYEFEGNHASPGFSSFIALVNPQWFINDNDIILRSFLAVLIFSWILFVFLSQRTSSINAAIIITLLFQLPLFYHYRYGLTTYIPEIPSALFLLSGYLMILLFFRSEKLFHFIIGIILIIVSIMFRFNFFVYAAFFFLPLTYQSIKILLKKSRIQITLTSMFLLGCLSFMIFYISSHFTFFMNYYNQKIPYAELSLHESFRTLFIDFGNEIGWIGLLALIGILFLANQQITTTDDRNKKEELYILYPFAFFFLFIILFAKSVNNPHIVAAMVVFLSAVFMVRFSFVKKLVNSLKGIYVRIGVVSLILLLNINYTYGYKKFSVTLPEQLAHKKVVDYIIGKKTLSPNYKYICLYDENVEIQIDVAVFRKTGICLNSSDHFYFHDLYLAQISPKLIVSECIDYYQNKIDSSQFDLVIINEKENIPIQGYKIAPTVNRELLLYMKNTTNYKFVKKEISQYHGNVLFFERCTSQH
jgi:hypothetical protein